MNKKLKVLVSAADSCYLKNSRIWDNIKDYVTEKSVDTVVNGTVVRTDTQFYMTMDTPADLYELVKLITGEDCNDRVDLGFNYYKEGLVYMEIFRYEG